MNGQTNTVLTVLQFPSEVPATPDTEIVPRPQMPKACTYCGLEGQHPEPEATVACTICGKAHGETIEVLDRKTGVLSPRRVLVLHSLEGVERAGGRKDGGSGNWVNPQAPWTSKPICARCSADLKCFVYDARKKAQADGAKWRELPHWPQFWALPLAEREAEHRNAVDAARHADDVAREERRAKLEALVAKGYSLHRSGPRRDDRGPRNGDHRNDGPRRDKRGNPNFGGKSFVTLDSAE